MKSIGGWAAIFLELTILMGSCSLFPATPSQSLACTADPASCGSGLTDAPASEGAPKVVVHKELVEQQLDIVVFYTTDCPHCHEALEYLDGLKARSSASEITLNVQKFNLTDNLLNQERFRAYAEAYGTNVKGVPSIFVGGENLIGFQTDQTPQLVTNAILTASEGAPVTGYTIKVPFLGTFDLTTVPLPALTVLVGLLDGFNPCAMWVLFVLLGILVGNRSRKKILFVGLVFVVSSGVVYFAFMATWLNVFHVLGFNKFTTPLLAFMALVMGAINLKEVFFFKRGVSLMISDGDKRKLTRKIYQLNRQTNQLLLLVSTMLLAVFVNFIELLCTAGFPALFTKILVERNESLTNQYLYMAVYNVVYVLPLFCIVLGVAFTLGRFRMTESHGRILKAISGSMMLFLGVIFLIKPSILF